MTSTGQKFPPYFTLKGEYSRPLCALIDLASFKKNIKNIQKHVGSSEQILVLKADAYGHGLVELAKASEGYNLAVAIPEELIKLRQAGIENKVWVLQGFFSIECLAYANTVWVLHSLWQLEFLQNALLSNEIDTLDICIKLDTGMHRLGFDRQELPLVKQMLANMPQIKVYGLLTHFAMSDHPENAQVHSQISCFDQILEDQNWEDLGQSMANSGAICFYQQAHRKWVRPGIMLYGGSPSPNINLPVLLEPVMSFQSAIIALHKVNKGEYVGYGNAWSAQVDSLIATIAVGYADGYPRHAPNGTPVAVINKASQNYNVVSLVGRVSMDMITLDVTGLENVSIGDKVELWGKLIAVDKIAELSGTISYELLTGVSKRVPRVYINS